VSAAPEEPGWLEARTGGVAAARRLAAAAGESRLWLLGAVALVAFGLQLATGLLLLFHYVPHPDHAFATAQAILWDVPFGWLVRLAHAHGASLLVALGFLHTLVSAVRADYKAPKELVWVCGRALFFLALAAALSGYVLPWSQLSYWATTITTAPLGKLPLVGEPLLALARGDQAVGGATLSRAFVAHVVAIPLLMVAGAALYAALLRRAAGTAPGPAPPGAVRARALELAMAGVAYLALLLALVVFAPRLVFPPHAHLPADPLETPNPIHPEWYFLWASALQRRVPELIELLPFSRGPLAALAAWLGEILPLGVIALVPLALLAVPFLDRGPERAPRRRPLAMAVIVAVVLALALLTAAGVAEAAPPASAGCVACHERDEDETVAAPVPEWRASVHAEAEVSCDGCHGGDPHAEDEDVAHDPDMGFVGTPGWRELPGFCGACHESIAEAYEAGTFGPERPHEAVPPSCASCHMATGHDTPRADVREILPDPLPPRLRRVPVLEEVAATAGPVAAREAEVEARVAALARRALPPSDLEPELARVRAGWVARFHRFEPASFAQAAPDAVAGLDALEHRAARLDDEAGRRGRLGVAGLATLGALFAALAAARRGALR
jgi:ubiquinol-cytochrome c reductase cytochrome b subunit